ncbi:MAG: acyl-CoA reductase [Deltaproteobacteria bacterium]
MKAALERARKARRRVLASHSNRDIIGAIATAAGNLDTRALVEELAGRLSMDRAMISHGLGLMLSALNPAALTDLVSDQAEDPRALEQAVDRDANGQARLGGPEVIFYGLAGNLPGLALPAIAASLLARSVCLLRDSNRQPLLTRALTASLADCDSDLAAMVVAMDWPAGDPGCEDEAFAAAGRVELYGSDETIDLIGSRHDHPDVVEHGHRLSIGYLAEGADMDSAASGFAEAAVIYEGLGCLSPQTIIVEGTQERAREFAEAMARGFEVFEKRWPRLPADPMGEAARRAFMDEAEMSSLGNPQEVVLVGKGGNWCVHLADGGLDDGLRPGPGRRCLRVLSGGPRQGLGARLDDSERPPLAAVGVATGEHDYPRLADIFERAGATWVCDPAHMQTPPLAWTQDGHCRLSSLLSWQSQP